jgi:hypothetical protein
MIWAVTASITTGFISGVMLFLIDMFPFTDEMAMPPTLIVFVANQPSSAQILANLKSFDPKLYFLFVSGIISAFNIPPNIPVAP